MRFYADGIFIEFILQWNFYMLFYVLCKLAVVAQVDTEMTFKSFFLVWPRLPLQIETERSFFLNILVPYLSKNKIK
jgi:hypothetical protein